MIRTNLSTRPFYNIRAVRGAIAVLAIVVAVVTAFNVAQIIRLTASQRTLGAKAQSAEQEAARLRREATQIVSRIDQKELEIVARAASEANSIIDRRTFSWTDLFTQLETTLPPDVRTTALTPHLEDKGLSIGVQARSVEDLDNFIEALEGTGAFRNVLATTEVTLENGTIEATLSAGYEQPSRRTEAQP